VIHFALCRRSDPDSRASNGFGYIGSEEPLIAVGTGSAVSPLNFCLSAQGYRQDRSDDHATLDGLKLSRLSSGFRLATVPALVVHCRECVRSG
jgi:hypothetical protein